MELNDVGIDKPEVLDCPERKRTTNTSKVIPKENNQKLGDPETRPSSENKLRKISIFWDQHKKAFVIVFKVLLLLCYLVYFGFALSYYLGDEGYWRLVGCTILGAWLVAWNYLKTTSCYTKFYEWIMAVQMTSAEREEGKQKKRITKEVANLYGIPLMCNVTNGCCSVDSYMMYLMLLVTGIGNNVIKDWKIYKVISPNGMTLVEMCKNNITDSFRNPSCIYKISYSDVYSQTYSIKAFTLNEANCVIENILYLFKRLLSQRSTVFKTLLVDLISPSRTDMYLGRTRWYRSSDRVIVFINVMSHSCLEHVIITFLHEMAHVLENKPNEQHQLEFYALNIAIKTVVLHQYKSNFGSIDEKLLRKSKIAVR